MIARFIAKRILSVVRAYREIEPEPDKYCKTIITSRSGDRYGMGFGKPLA